MERVNRNRCLAPSDLRRHPWASSRAEAIGDGQAVGSLQAVGSFVLASGGGSRAVMWSALNAFSAVNLHPAGATSSSASDVDGGVQVGSAKIAGVNRAWLWKGTALSGIDLHQYLPAGYLSSVANDVWTDGSTIRVVGKRSKPAGIKRPGSGSSSTIPRSFRSHRPPP